MESMDDAEVFYARPSVSADAFCQAVASTAGRLQSAAWQPSQQLDCLLELEGCMQVRNGPRPLGIACLPIDHSAHKAD